MKLAIRVDASPQIGTGHLMRCLSLALAWQGRGGEVTFLTQVSEEYLLERIRQEGFEVYPIRQPGGLTNTRAILAQSDYDWVVLDGYHFDSDYQKAIKELGLKLLVVDDFAHLEHYYGDVILNQNYGAENFSYSVEPYTRCLLGPKFVLLRPDFRNYAALTRKIPPVAGRLLITLGGVDIENDTLKVLRAVNQVELPLEVKIVMGGTNPHFRAVQAEAAGSRHHLEILSAVKNMAALMTWAEVAVSAGGTTVWELAHLGVPALLGIVADNQVSSVSALSRDGLFISLGTLKDVDPKTIATQLTHLLLNRPLRRAMSEKCRALVDGQGGPRLLAELELTANKHHLRQDLDFGEVKFINFLNLSGNEREMVREWRNADNIRKWMLTDHIISREEHTTFINNLQRNDNKFYWMLKINNIPSGVVDLQEVDLVNGISELGIYSMKKGSGKIMLYYLLYFWFDTMKMIKIRCEVVENNRPAYNLYKHFGFMENNIIRSFHKNDFEVKLIQMELDNKTFAQTNSAGQFKVLSQ